eukprot:1363071-Rhodomonas_salina.1
MEEIPAADQAVDSGRRAVQVHCSVSFCQGCLSALQHACAARSSQLPGSAAFEWMIGHLNGHSPHEYAEFLEKCRALSYSQSGQFWAGHRDYWIMKMRFGKPDFAETESDCESVDWEEAADQVTDLENLPARARRRILDGFPKRLHKKSKGQS